MRPTYISRNTATGLFNNDIEIKGVSESEKMAFILGNEGSGVSKELFNMSDKIIKIDMNNIDSLNVAIAGAIVLNAFSNL